MLQWLHTPTSLRSNGIKVSFLLILLLFYLLYKPWTIIIINTFVFFLTPVRFWPEVHPWVNDVDVSIFLY